MSTDYLREAADELYRQKEVWLATLVERLGLTPERAAKLFYIEESAPRLETDPNTHATTLRMDLRLRARK